MLEQAYHFLSVFVLQHHCHLIKSMFDVLQYLFVQVHWWALVTLMMNSKWCYHILHSKGTNHTQIRLKWVIRVSFVEVVGRNVTSECDVNYWNRNTLSVWSSDLDACLIVLAFPTSPTWQMRFLLFVIGERAGGRLANLIPFAVC